MKEYKKPILFSSEFSEHPSKSPLIKGRLRGDVKLNANRLMNSILLTKKGI